jgi:hypothetical protein
MVMILMMTCCVDDGGVVLLVFGNIYERLTLIDWLNIDILTTCITYDGDDDDVVLPM